MTVAAAEWSVWSTEARLVVTEPQQLGLGRTILEDLLAAVDAACSRFRDDSELARLADELPAGATVSPVLEWLVGAALDAARWTGGAVDPTLGAVLAGLGYDRDIRDLRGPDAPPRPFGISVVAADRRNWRSVRLHDGVLTVPAGLTLDLGASAKAAAADRAARILAERLGCGVLVSLGGDIATAGIAPAGGWQVSVQDAPGDPRSPLALAAGSAVATSSTQHRRWEVDGRRMHHILDPRTGLPAEPVWRSVSVAADSCLLANALSTAAIVRGHAAVPMLRRAGVPARLVDRAGRTITVGGWPDEAATSTGVTADLHERESA